MYVREPETYSSTSCSAKEQSGFDASSFIQSDLIAYQISDSRAVLVTNALCNADSSDSSGLSANDAAFTSPIIFNHILSG